MRLKTIGLSLVALLAIPGVGASAAPAAENPSLAHFEGRIIDLRVSWEEATACATDGWTTTCFRTEAEMDAFLGDRATPTIEVKTLGLKVDVNLALACSPTVRIYSGTSYATLLLTMTGHGFYNLGSYGVADLTSSYKNQGTCDASFFDTTGGSTLYPGNTSAGAQSASMLLGWDNRVGSVDID